jgi:hypothetical protein
MIEGVLLRLFQDLVGQAHRRSVHDIEAYRSDANMSATKLEGRVERRCAPLPALGVSAGVRLT